MDFIKYALPPLGKYSTRDISPSILKTRRQELGLTQQQVATGAHLALKQYQRLESGERTIEGASLLVALPICAVLKLDPFTFLPQAEEMNVYSDTIARKEQPVMKEDLILRLVAHACHLYNSKIGTDYSLDNIVIAFCTANNAYDVYSEFTSQYGFYHKSVPISHFSRNLMTAFVGETDCDDPNHVDGILIRTDAPEEMDNPEEYLHMIVHELSHIFCVTNEIETAPYAGQRFTDLYCKGIPASCDERILDGTMNAGYSIWSEFIAEIMADIVDQQRSRSLQEIQDYLLVLASDVKAGNPSAKASLQHYLALVMNSREGGETATWPELQSIIEKSHLPFMELIHLVFDNLHHGQCYEITPDFISQLGTAYMVAAIQNTPPEDVMTVANTYSYKFSES